MQSQRSKASYRAHRYSGPKRGRKASRAQLKRFHGDTNTTHEDIYRKKSKPNEPIENEPIPSTRRADVWRKKTEKSNAENTNTIRCYSNRSSLKRQSLQNAGDGDAGKQCTSDIQEQHTKDQDVCMQIKSSLQKLRRKSNPEEPRPLLELEVFPDNAKPETAVPETDDHEFVDESEEPQDIEEKKDKKKRRSRRQAILKKKQEKAEAASNKPVIEKVYLDKIHKKFNKDEENNETDKNTNSLQHKELLYEFGKFVAEQLMTFNEKDTNAAKTEIKEVLTKYRLKYKILTCMTKPNKVTAVEKPQSVSTAPATNEAAKSKQAGNRPKPAPNIITPSQVKSALAQTNSSSIKKKSVGPSSFAPINSIQAKQTIAANISATEPAGPTKEGVAQPRLLNAALTSDAPHLMSLLLVPSENDPSSLKLALARIDATGAVMTFPNAPTVSLQAITPDMSNPLQPASVSQGAVPGAPSNVATLTLTAMSTAQSVQRSECIGTGANQMPPLNSGTRAELSSNLNTPLLRTYERVPQSTSSVEPQPLISETNEVEADSIHETLMEVPSLPHVDITDPLKVEPSASHSELMDTDDDVLLKCEPDSDMEDS